MNQQQHFYPEEMAELHQLVQVCRSSKKKTRQTNSRAVICEDQRKEKPMEVIKELQGKPMPEHRPLSVGLYFYSFLTSCVLSGICSSKTPHALLPGSIQHLFSAKYPRVSASAKHPLIRQFPEQHHMVPLSLQKK